MQYEYVVKKWAKLESFPVVYIEIRIYLYCITRKVDLNKDLLR
jgi:hypothetical protein